MSNFTSAPIDVKANLMATVIRVNAIIQTLPAEQLEKYNKLIEEHKKFALENLKDVLTSEELENFVKIL